VLDGLCCAAETLGSTRAVVWLHEHDRDTRRVLEEAIVERRAQGVQEPPVTVVTGPSSYVSGESSAIARALAGGPALPSFHALRRSPQLTADRPTTVVHNVETLARVALAARECHPGVVPAVECYAPGPLTTVLTVLTPTCRHVMETWTTASLRDCVMRSCWPADRTPASVLLGGFGGAWARWSDVADLEVHEGAMRSAGVTLGPGIVAPMGAAACGVAETAAIVGYLAESSARQCGPCVFGLRALAQDLESLRAGSGRPRELRRIADDLTAIRGRGACHHPDGAVRLVESAVETFRLDFDWHARGRRCVHWGSPVIPVPRVR
jgi:NADH:ubiquinone oxidoreductase subunit F (NADH-binding)